MKPHFVHVVAAQCKEVGLLSFDQAGFLKWGDHGDGVSLSEEVFTKWWVHDQDFRCLLKIDTFSFPDCREVVDSADGSGAVSLVCGRKVSKKIYAPHVSDSPFIQAATGRRDAFLGLNGSTTFSIFSILYFSTGCNYKKK